MNGLNVPLGRKAPQVLVQAAHIEINALLNDLQGIDSVLLASTDGFELTSVHKKPDFEAGKFAAVSSSILALVKAFLTEINLVGCQSITLDAENGKALIVSIPAVDHPMVMVVITDSTVLLGNLLHRIKVSSQKIAQLERQYSA
ncbi:roadblock/LC7 domain-containing protein [Aquirhabdus parva]|uniref:Roadblock/LC7 domain-containing protein n=1 Tax=Aquirhabdus parva TaxID=2283318 RepID=A0A345P3T8_9GAMM|nr:roadblock/LC7 domain-containing protein [Aquirhabdus parva]AXI01947.1 roadblock/LC7 domain-containing protein [Aquirhabdus parva]